MKLNTNNKMNILTSFSGITPSEKQNILSPALQKDCFEKREETIKNHKFYVNLSKNISYALRHNPKGCNLEIDAKGYVPISQLLAYLNSNGEWENITKQDIADTIKNIEKKRFEITGENIRAYYGHSCSQKIEKEEAVPPKLLYHGTSHEVVEKILKEGITPQSRQYVHLSSDIKTAVNVGTRKDKKPVILVINAQKANEAGNKFYNGNQTTWLADYIPPEYISILENDKI